MLKKIIFCSLMCVSVTNASISYKYSVRTPSQGEVLDNEMRVKWYKNKDYIYILNERQDWDVHHKRFTGAGAKLKLNNHLEYEHFSREIRDYKIDTIRFYDTLILTPNRLFKPFNLRYGISGTHTKKSDLKGYLGIKSKVLEVNYDIGRQGDTTSIKYRDKVDMWGLDIKPNLEYRRTMPSNSRYFKASIEVVQ